MGQSCNALHKHHVLSSAVVLGLLHAGATGLLLQHASAQAALQLDIKLHIWPCLLLTMTAGLVYPPEHVLMVASASTPAQLCPALLPS